MTGASWQHRMRALAAELLVRIRHGLSAFPGYRHTEAGLIFIAAIVGTAVGGSVVVFHEAVGYAEGFFRGFFAQATSTGWLRFILFPVITAAGGLAVGVLRATVFAKIPDDDLATVERSVQGHADPTDRQGWIKAIMTAALSIGSGGGAGREAPTVVVGASVGSALSHVFRLHREHQRTLSGAGTAAAISGIFNAPLGGVLFAVELIFGDLRLRSFIPLVVSSVMSTAIVRLFLGNESLLVSPAYSAVSLSDFAILAVAGMASGGIALYFLRTFRWWHDRTRRYVSRWPIMLRPAIGGLGAGMLVAFLPSLLETTYQPVNEAIRGHGVLALAALTVLVKPVSAAFTLGSGGAGGTFAPALKTGALFGFCVGSLLSIVIPNVNPGTYALVCTAAVVAGTYRIPLTAAILAFEISQNYELILPLLFASVFAAFVIGRADIPSFHPADQRADRST